MMRRVNAEYNNALSNRGRRTALGSFGDRQSGTRSSWEEAAATVDLMFEAARELHEDAEEVAVLTD